MNIVARSNFDIWDDIAHESIKRLFWKEKNLIVLCLVFIFDLFVFSWSGSLIGDQRFSWSGEPNSWVNFNWSGEPNSWPSFDWSEQPHSWPNFENKKWPLRQKCQNLWEPKKTSKKGNFYFSGNVNLRHICLCDLIKVCKYLRMNVKYSFIYVWN